MNSWSVFLSDSAREFKRGAADAECRKCTIVAVPQTEGVRMDIGHCAYTMEDPVAAAEWFIRSLKEEGLSLWMDFGVCLALMWAQKASMITGSGSRLT
jgi:hypothetical protein